MWEAGCDVPSLVQPSAKLYGRSGADCSEQTITAEARMKFSLDGHDVHVPVFVQPGSNIPCLLGMNVLPLLGVQFLHGNGTALLAAQGQGQKWHHSPWELSGNHLVKSHW